MTQADDGASEAGTQEADPAGLEDALSAADVEWRALAPDDDAFLVDGVRPGYVCTPASVDELSAAVRAASQAGATVIPWGGGTRMSLGFPPRAADLVVQTERLSEIVEYEPADLTVTVQAGMRLADLQARLRAEGQMLALDPAAADRATIGGLIAANASGPLRLLYGTARDLVIGTRVVNADGVISKAGGRVVKNVAGYDLNKLYVGSLGTVGVIVELSFKLHPLPQAQGMLLASFASAEDAAAAIAHADALPARPGRHRAAGRRRGCRPAGQPARRRRRRAAGRRGDRLREGGAAAARRRRRAAARGPLSTTAVREGDTLDGLWSALREFSDPSSARHRAAEAGGAAVPQRRRHDDGAGRGPGGRLHAEHPGPRRQRRRLPEAPARGSWDADADRQSGRRW